MCQKEKTEEALSRFAIALLHSRTLPGPEYRAIFHLLQRHQNEVHPISKYKSRFAMEALCQEGNAHPEGERKRREIRPAAQTPRWRLHGAWTTGLECIYTSTIKDSDGPVGASPFRRSARGISNVFSDVYVSKDGPPEERG
jgi:hypothetical protein